MMKKIVGIVMAMMLIMVILVFGGSALMQVDTSNADGTMMGDIINMIQTTADGSFIILMIIIVLLAVGALILVFNNISGSSGRGRRRKSRK